MDITSIPNLLLPEHLTFSDPLIVYPWKADQSLLGHGVLRGDFAKYGSGGQKKLGNVKSICKLMGKLVSDH